MALSTKPAPLPTPIFSESEYGGRFVTIPSPPEPVYVPPVPLSADDVKTRFGWSDDTFRLARQRFGFPKPVDERKRQSLWNPLKQRIVILWDAEQVREWARDLTTLAATVSSR